jgi:hypothetical protein
MKTFRLKADVTFDAENIDDAFRILADYFTKLSKSGLPMSSIFTSGSINISRDSPLGESRGFAIEHPVAKGKA